MHLLLLIPSSLLLILLFAHSWRYRGRTITLAFFGLCFAFGVLRGNIIHYIITTYLGGESLPYLFLRPVVKVWNASLQECIGWIFALYLSWSIVEWIMTRQGKNSVGIFRLIGLSCFLMGSIAYAVEAAAAGVRWWVWVFPIKNPFFADVPFAGIVAWMSVGVDFLGPFLLFKHRVIQRWPKYLLFLIFPAHMLFHLKVTNIASWLPMNTAELWYLIMICALIWGIAVGGPEITADIAIRREKKDKSPLRFAVLFTAGAFLSVLLAAQILFIKNAEITVSLIPFCTALLFFNPVYAGGFLVLSSILFALLTGAWSYTLIPAVLFVIFGLGSDWFSTAFSFKVRHNLALALILAAVLASYLICNERYRLLLVLNENGEKILNERTNAGLDSLLTLLPPSTRAGDAYHYNHLATDLLKRRNYPAATRLLQKALACDSTYAYAYINLGWALRQQKDYSGSVQAYEKGLSINPVDFRSYLLLGEIYVALDSLEKAEALYRRALNYDQNNTDILLALETVLYRQNRLDEAVKLLKSTQPEKVDRKKIESRLAADLFKMGRNEEAVSYYQNVIREDISHLYAAATSLALIYWQERKDPKKALNYVNLAGAVNPTAEIFSLKGAICEELGLKEESREAYRLAAELESSKSGAEEKVPSK